MKRGEKPKAHERQGDKAAANPLKSGLYLVATPIGNLGDMSFRAVETLGRVDCIYCEDTRVAARLLRHFDIRTKTQTYHEHNAEARREQILASLLQGKALALISDAGLPLISDPGFKLVRDLRALGHDVTSVPGASATLTALQVSGLATDRFSFLGFVPSKASVRAKFFEEAKGIPTTIICFERASRVLDTLQSALEALGDRQAAICRELTKLYEEVIDAQISALIKQVQDRATPLKGEVVLVIERARERTVEPEDVDKALREALEQWPVKDAAKRVADELNLSKRDLYQRALALKQD